MEVPQRLQLASDTRDSSAKNVKAAADGVGADATAAGAVVRRLRQLLLLRLPLRGRREMWFRRARQALGRMGANRVAALKVALRRKRLRQKLRRPKSMLVARGKLQQWPARTADDAHGIRRLQQLPPYALVMRCPGDALLWREARHH